MRVLVSRQSDDRSLLQNISSWLKSADSLPSNDVGEGPKTSISIV